MNKPMIMMATSVLASLALLHPPSGAQEEGNNFTHTAQAQRGGTNIFAPDGGPLFDFRRIQSGTSAGQGSIAGQLSGTGAGQANVGPNNIEGAQGPSIGINPLIEFSIDQDVLNASILDDPIDKGIYRKPDAYEAERALLADHATLADHAVTATLAQDAQRAFNADVAIRVEEKLPYGQAWDFGLTQAQEGSRTFTQHYARPTGADSVLVNANCITAGEKGDLSRVTISFDGGFTRSISLCQSGRTSGTEEQSRGYNAVNLDVPRNATSLSITQYVEKNNNGGTAITDGFVQWFGPHSQVASATPPTAGGDTSTTPTPPTSGGGTTGYYNCTGSQAREDCYINETPTTPHDRPVDVPTTGGEGLCFIVGPNIHMAACDGREDHGGYEVYIGDGVCDYYENLYANSVDCDAAQQEQTTEAEFFCASTDFGFCTRELDELANSGLTFPNIGTDTLLVCVGVGLDGPGIVPTRLDCINSDGVPYRKVS